MQIYNRLYIAGQWVAPATSSVLSVVSPCSEEIIAQVPEGSKADIDRAIVAARGAQDHGPWPRLPVQERVQFLHKLAAALRERAGEFSRLQSEEAGSPFSFTSAMVPEGSAAILDYYAELGTTYPFEEIRRGFLGENLVLRQPVGVVGAIVPWNFPLPLTIFKLAPALLAGCTVVLKPAPETPLYSYQLAQALDEIGLPAGVVNIVPAGREAGEYLVMHPGVDKIAFTGSTEAGRRIASLCGQALKHVSCELGGKSAAILLDDVVLDHILTFLIYAAVPNNGQTCVAQTRILVPQSRYDELAEAICERTKALVVGDPLDPRTEIGPLLSPRQRERVEGYIASGVAEGATIAVGGGRPVGMPKGWFVEPTVFVNVKNSMRIAQEEIFGPVVVVMPYADEEEAIKIANDSIYGLSGTVWTADPQRGVAIARRIQAGACGVNNFGLDWVAPVGGFKQSGIGRELGPEGLEEYFELQSILMPPNISQLR